MSTTTVLILLAISNPACGFIGYLIGRISRDTADTKEAVMHEVEETDGVDPVPRESRPVSRWRANTVVLISAAVAATGIITAIVGFNVTRNQDRLVGCVVGYSNATADAFEARRVAANDANQQVENVFRAFLAAFNDTPAAGRDRVRLAFEQYIKAREESKKVQKDNPLPDAPRDACSELLD